MNDDFENLDLNTFKKDKLLGRGMFGTTYLVKYNNKNYALKVQKILPSQRKKNLKHGIWREIDLYDYVNTLSKNEQKFFTKLYTYTIYKNCKHKQKRPRKLNPKGKFGKMMIKMDSSVWCINLLMEYQDKINLYDFVSLKKLTVKQTYSFIFQIIHIHLILYKGGYSHNDLHPKNIMIKKTTDKYFMFNNKKIPYYGYQLVAIDYGLVLHKKFKLKLNEDSYEYLWKKDKEKWLFKEIFWSIIKLIYNEPKYRYNCDKKKIKYPFRRKNKYSPTTKVLKNMLKHHMDFWIESKKEFINSKIIEKDILKLESKIKIDNGKNVRNILKNNINKDEIFFILGKIKLKFDALYPKLFSKYNGWCSYHKINIPTDDMIKILHCKNHKELIKFLYTKKI